jgi:hypothetical protein
LPSSVTSGVRLVRTTGQAIQRDNRCGVSCPSEGALASGIAPKLRQNRFKYSSTQALKLRYLLRLYVKELVQPVSIGILSDDRPAFYIDRRFCEPIL